MDPPTQSKEHDKELQGLIETLRKTQEKIKLLKEQQRFRQLLQQQRDDNNDVVDVEEGMTQPLPNNIGFFLSNNSSSSSYDDDDARLQEEQEEEEEEEEEDDDDDDEEEEECKVSVPAVTGRLKREVSSDSLHIGKPSAIRNPNTEEWRTRATQRKRPSLVTLESNPPSVLSDQTSSSNDEKYSYLHQACRLYPTTPSVVEIALRVDPSQVAERIPTQITENKRTSFPFKVAGTPSPSSSYSLPINIALRAQASLEVLTILVENDASMLLEKDGPDDCNTLLLALYQNRSKEVIDMLLKHNPACVQALDRRRNTPLHVACARRAELPVVQSLVEANPTALLMKNFHGQRPLEVAQRSTSLQDDVVNFLQEKEFALSDTKAEMELFDLDVWEAQQEETPKKTGDKKRPRKPRSKASVPPPSTDAPSTRRQRSRRKRRIVEL